LNGSMLILMSKLLKCAYSAGHSGTDGPTCGLVVLNYVWPALHWACHSNAYIHAFFPKCIYNHCQGTALFLRFAQNLMHTCSSFIRSTTKLHQARYTTCYGCEIRRMKWVWHMAWMGEQKKHIQNCWLSNPSKSSHV
jgi:hypothetical protein